MNSSIVVERGSEDCGFTRNEIEEEIDNLSEIMMQDEMKVRDKDIKHNRIP